MDTKNKKAVSPVVSTVLLVLIVIILAIIILLWSRGFIKEVILKEIPGEESKVIVAKQHKYDIHLFDFYFEGI